MANELFGTDGVRGVANTELTPELAFSLGQAAVQVLGDHIVIGRDTRRSGQMLECAFASGVMSAGGVAHSAGIIPTPAVAFLTRLHNFDAGCVISASHNPPEYNGIKFFNNKGLKLSSDIEDRVAEKTLAKTNANNRGIFDEVGHFEVIDNAVDEYVDHAIKPLVQDGVSLKGLTIAVDCGHGASYKATPKALEKLGATVHAFNTDFNGLDINVNSGSTHLNTIQELVAQTNADIGISHDGDADRMLAVDHLGNECDGDFLLAICAQDLKEQNKLVHDEVVSTVMCNLGFVKAMERLGINVAQTQVGDKYVLDYMLKNGALIGGEQSGHIIFLEHNSTGDGLCSALQLMSVMVRKNKSLHELMQVMERFPQVLINVNVADKKALDKNEPIWNAVESEEDRLGSDGRVLVRASGTEPLVRVMVEAATEDIAQTSADRIARVVQEQIGR